MNFSDFSDLDLNGKTDFLFNRVSGYEVKLSQKIADKANRHAELRKKNHINHTKSDFNENADLIGLYGECIFAKAFKLEVDWETKLRDEVDFEVGPICIDVKSTEYSPYLSVKCHRLHDDFIYVLCACRIKFNDGKLVGWLKGSDIPNLGEKIENVTEPYWRVPYTSLNKGKIKCDPVG